MDVDERADRVGVTVWLAGGSCEDVARFGRARVVLDAPLRGRPVRDGACGGPGSADRPAGCADEAAAPDECDAPEAPGGPGRLVAVHWSCAGSLRALPRRVADTPTAPVSALAAQLEGPSAAERRRGFTSVFSRRTAGGVAGVAVYTDGLAVVEPSPAAVEGLPGAGAGDASGILRELDATAFQFPEVEAVEYRVDGRCAPFGAPLPDGSCRPRPRR